MKTWLFAAIFAININGQFSRDENKYNEIYKLKTLESWVISHKIYQMRPGLFPIKYVPKKICLENCSIVSFLRTEDVELTGEDAIECYNKYSDDVKNLIFIDPPYINSCNDMYTNKRNLNIYEYLNDNPIKNKSAKIILCLENSWIIQLLFKKYSQIVYDKKYEMSKKKTTHVIISNKKLMIPNDANLNPPI